MNRTVWKYPVPVDDVFDLDLPQGSEVLHVAEQGAQLCLWALVAPARPAEHRRFRLSGTGHPIVEPVRRHVGSVLLRGGSLVFHLFELEAP